MRSAAATAPARPYALIVRTTERCLVGCDHCCIDATGRGTDISPELVERVAGEACEAGVGLAHFSGGEPLLHDRLTEFVRAATEQGLYAEVTTSTFSTPGDRPAGRLDELVEAGLQRVMLSYDASHAGRVSIEQ